MPRNTSRHNRLWLIALALLVLATAGFWWFKHNAGAANVAPAAGQGGLPVEGTQARTGTLEQTLTVVGQLSANQGVALKPEIAGRVASIPFTEGQPVKKGTVLIKLDDSVQQAQLAQANANLNLANNNLARAQRLVNEGAASKQQVEMAEADARLAQANVQLAQANLAKTRLVAPFDGIAGIRQVNVGDYVVPGDTLVNVTQNNSLRATFRLPETDAMHLSANASVTIVTDEGTQIDAQVNAIDAQIDPTSRTREVQVKVENGEETLMAGQFIRITVPLNAVEDAVIVPLQTLVPMAGKIFAFTVNPGPNGVTMASKTEVTVGLRTDSEAQILSGIAGGQTVVTAGQQKLQAPVMPVTVLSPTVITTTEPPVETLEKTAE